MSSPVQQTTPRVQMRPLLTILVLALFLPVAVAFLADWMLDTSPLIVLIVAVICIPLASLLIINRSMRDLNALIAVVAPPEVFEAPEDENADGVDKNPNPLPDQEETNEPPKENSHIGGSESLPMD